MRWENNLPVPEYTPPVTKEAVNQMSLTALSLPYEGEYDPVSDSYVVEPEFEGRTNLEVAFIRRARKAAGGDSKELDALLDRVLGKPKQSTETVQMRMSYTQYLDFLAEKDAQDTEAGDPWDNENIKQIPSSPSSIFDPIDEDLEEEDLEEEDLLAGL